MRVTNKMLSNSFLTDMQNNLENMKIIQQQMTSGKEIRKPSDDPFKAARSMQLHTDINANKQYNDNIKDTINWLDTTDTALGQAGNILQRVRELLVSAGNASYGSDERKAIRDEISQRIDEFSQVLNTNFDGKYVFGGSRGTAKPTATIKDGDNIRLAYYSNNSSSPELLDTDPSFGKETNKLNKKLQVEVSQGVTMEYNVTASDVLQFTAKLPNGDTKSYDLRQLFNNILNHLDGKTDNGTVPAVGDKDPVSQLSGDDLQGLMDTINNLLKIRSEVGAKQNRMDSAQQKNEDETSNLTEILSKTEDIDITQKTMEYATLQTVYMASLQTSARIIQPTLMDYLR